MSNKMSNNTVQRNDRLVLAGHTGFTLIELMIALAILAFGMLAAATMQYSAIRNNTKGNIYTQANMLAKAKLEYLKNLDINDPELVPRTEPPYTDGSFDGNGNPGGIYTRFWTIRDWGTQATQARRITMTIEWTRLGKTRNVVLTSNTRGSGV
jgi:prepilin-type N-terminal cleavage/methylation domain-containing protein